MDWGIYAKRLLRTEMARNGVSYADLVKLLAEAGVKDSEANLRNKVSRGAFTAGFLLQCLSLMGVKTISLD